MRLFTARRLALAALVPALLVFSVIPGCSNEGEGERCGDPPPYSTLNDDDCSSGLVCTAANALENGMVDMTNRCCYSDHVSDSRCARAQGTSATNTPNGGGSNNEAGAGPTETGGSSAANGGGGGLPMTAELPAGAGGV